VYWKLVEIRRRGCKSLEMTGYVSLSLSQWLRWGARAKAESKRRVWQLPRGVGGIGWMGGTLSLPRRYHNVIIDIVCMHTNCEMLSTRCILSCYTSCQRFHNS
jgi:hypothetical protein